MVRKQCLGGDKYTKEPFYKMWLSADAKKKDVAFRTGYIIHYFAFFFPTFNAFGP